MEVGLWMTTAPVTIGPEARISAAARLFSQHGVRRLPVVERGPDGPILVGLVSSHDVWRAAPPDMNPLSPAAWPAGADRPVASVMARKLVTTTPDTPIETAARLLRTHRIGALPVLRGATLVGIISASDLLDAFLETLGAGTTGLRVTFETDADEEVIGAMAALASDHGVRLASALSLHHADRDSERVRHLGVVRFAGRTDPDLVEAIWTSGHRVRGVLAEEPAAGVDAGGPRTPSAAARTR